MQTGVLDRKGNPRRERLDHLLVHLVEAPAVALVGQVEGTDDPSIEIHRHAEERSHTGMGGGPPHEPRVGADVVAAVCLAVLEDGTQQPVGPRQRTDGGHHLVAQARRDELGELPLVVGDADGGIPGTDETSSGLCQPFEAALGAEVDAEREHGVIDGPGRRVPRHRR